MPADTQQDFTLLSSSEEGGVTTLTFRRKRDTGDDGDLRIEVSWPTSSSSSSMNIRDYIQSGALSFCE